MTPIPVGSEPPAWRARDTWGIVGSTAYGWHRVRWDGAHWYAEGGGLRGAR